MRCGNCGAEIGSGGEPNMSRRERSTFKPTVGRVFGRVLLGVFSAGWAVTAAISEYMHTMYVTNIHRVDFSQQTPSFFREQDTYYRVPGDLFFMGSCLWLALALFVWAWKLANHFERSKALAESLRSRPPTSDA